MTYEEERVVTRSENHGPPHSHHEVVEEPVTYRPSPFLAVERAIVFIFGLIQALLLFRIILLLLAAREANPIVNFVYDLSEIFVVPFRGMFAIDAVDAGQAALDIAAIVALIGWTILELLILALLRVFRPAATA